MQAMMEAFANQMRDFAAGIIQQQQQAIQGMLNANACARQSPKGVDEKFYKKVENFTGEQSWRDWAFQFKSASKMAQQEAYELLIWAEKEETEIDDELGMSPESKVISSALFNILGTVVKGEPPQMLHTSGFSGAEAWRKLSKRYSPTTPMRGMQLMMAAVNPGKAKKLGEVSGHIDKWETKILALSRDFGEKISDKMKAAILVSMLPTDLQHTLVQQADKLSDYKSTKERVISIIEAKMALKDPDAMDCDAVRKSQVDVETEVDGQENYECDIDVVGGKGGPFCYRCGGQGHIAAKCGTPPPAKGSGKGKGGGKGERGGKGPGGKGGKGKGGDWQGYCSYCGKRGHGPRDCWTKQRDEANGSNTAGKTDIGDVEEDVGGFDIGCIHRKRNVYPPGLRTFNRFEALDDDVDQDICPVDVQEKKGRITIDSGAAESVWPEGLLPEIQTTPPTGPHSGVTYIAANGSRMPNLGEKKVRFKTKDGCNSSITFQVTRVKKPLAAVSKITEKGNWVCFGPNEAYIENAATGRRTQMELHNGTYSIDVEYFGEQVFSRQDAN